MSTVEVHLDGMWEQQSMDETVLPALGTVLRMVDGWAFCHRRSMKRDPSGHIVYCAVLVGAMFSDTPTRLSMDREMPTNYGLEESLLEAAVRHAAARWMA